jgi:hypothetical protein
MEEAHMNQTITKIGKIWVLILYLLKKELANKVLKKLKSQSTNYLITKWINKLIRQTSEEKIQMSSKYVKKSPLWSLAIKEMQIKMTIRFHLTTVKMAIKKTNKIKCC